MAAVTGSGAASLVLLVLGLAKGRKANTEHRDEIKQAIHSVEEARQRFNAAADADAQALVELLGIQAELRSMEDRGRYHQALLNAAAAPLQTAEECLNLLRIIDSQMRRASRFTVVDLGAAGALTFGALQAATMMADINLALLIKEPDVNQSNVQVQSDKSTNLVQQGRQVAESINNYTRSKIRGKE